MLRTLLGFWISLPLLFAAGTTVRFDAVSPDAGPFPSDAFTIGDTAQKTGRRVNLPLPDCGAQPSSCDELNLVNQLDGFSLTARVRARFSGAVDTSTLAGGLILVALDNLTQDEPGLHQPGTTIAVNQVVYDPATDTVYAKPDSVLDQHRRYALVVLDTIKDRAGDAAGPDPAYQVCAQGNGGEYCAALATVVPNLTSILAPRKIVAASIFTTQSATQWLERARTLLDQVPPDVKPTEPRAFFKVPDLSSLVLKLQTGTNPAKFSSFTIPLDPQLLQGLGTFAMGSFASPNFLSDKQTIANSPTASDLALPGSSNRVFFNALLPESAKPDAGYPVVIFGHGFGDSRFGGPTAVSPTLTGKGFAVVAINAVGHGFGPESSVTLTDKAGNSTTIRSGGRSVDLNGDGTIDGNEGCAITTPVALGTRDCFRQTVVDLLQLVRAIRAGIDLDGDGKPDLDANRIYYAGQSLGAIYGTMLSALEPGVRAAALNVGGGSITDIARWSPSYRGLATASLGLRNPSLLNKGDSWDQDYVLRDQPVKVISVPGAVEIQNYFETVDWLGTSGDPISFAPHLKTSPLAGNAAKPVLFQFALGDRTVPNPANSALIRAANLRENAWMYRHDRALKIAPDLPANPHPYLVLFADLDGETVKLPGIVGLGISTFAQQQVAGFFAADGASIPDPNNVLVQLLIGAPLFEVPAKLPETLGF